MISFTAGDPSTVDWKARYAPQARVRLQTDSASTALHGIKGGLGVARLPIAIGEADANIERIPDIPVELGLDVWLLTHVDVRTNARIRVFRDFVRGFYAQRKPLWEGEALDQGVRSG